MEPGNYGAWELESSCELEEVSSFGSNSRAYFMMLSLDSIRARVSRVDLGTMLCLVSRLEFSFVLCS